jgi:hypothetical protein
VAAGQATVPHWREEPAPYPAHRDCQAARPCRDLDSEFEAFHRAITERNTRILYRGTDVASYDEPKALAQRG